MEQEHAHELSAAYVLDSLDDNDRREFEEHLRDCTICVEELDSLRSAASSLAYAVEGPAPPPAVRERLLERVRSERPSNVVPLRRRIALPAVAAVAAAAACAAIGLGVWAATLSSRLDREQSARRADARAVAILASANARRLPLGQKGQVVVLPTGEAALAVPGLPKAPKGKTYEVWVIGAGGPRPAGLFAGGGDSLVALERTVPKAAKVAITLEPAGGRELPTGPILFAT